MHKINQIIAESKSCQHLFDPNYSIVFDNIQQEALIISSVFLTKPQNIVIIKKNQYEANQLFQSLKSTLNHNVLLFTVDESFRVEALAASPEILSERILTMHQLNSDEPHILICHVHSLLRILPSQDLFHKATLELNVGQRINIFELAKKLEENGYLKENRVDLPLQYARRGGVIDVFSIQYDKPIRIEFFDDEIEDIRFYNTKDQKTVERLKTITLLPATDVLYDPSQVENVIKVINEKYHSYDLAIEQQEHLSEIVDIAKENLRSHVSNLTMYGYLGLFSSSHILEYVKDAKVLLSSEEEVQFAYRNYVEENFYYYENLEADGKILKGLQWYHELNDVIKEPYFTIKQAATSADDIILETQSVDLKFDQETVLIEQIKQYCKDNKVIFCLENQHHVTLLIELLDRHQLHYVLVGTTDQLFDGINIYVGTLNKGVYFVAQKIIVFTSTELFPQHSTKKKQKYLKFKDATVIKDYQELHIGDYVVHDSHGIGKYLGIKTLEVQGCKRDYLYVQYANEATLYIPVEQFKLIRKYSSGTGKTPILHELGGTKWQKTKKKIQAKVNDIAQQLIEIYAARIAQKGFAFNQDTQEQLDFENAFGFPLTPDQERSVEEIKRDMEKVQPMDRLLCGDVGFGKTEVALRGVCKAVLSNKQVAILCPTTILSMQHYKVASKRFEEMGVSIALLNRFTSTKQKRIILEQLKEGQIDILVGTHRILSKDVIFKDLGLLVVDEEQRFGVGQKEKIKMYRELIDVLTLTATPIPRTLQMSLMNIRGFSKIDTPPKDRLPVQTYVVEKNHQLIKQVIERELTRNGQVFYLYNRTSEIENVAYRLSMELPNARIAVGHGKMTKDQLEDVMVSFINHEYDILVCTTIIETGIDISNANTIIVEDANRFGLSQLYQIRGRVGRSNRMAYAYLLYQGEKQINEEAQKRLQSIKEFTQLGSGYKIAMRDLTMRGAGDILGGQQAGFIDDIGYDMYMKILQDTIDKMTNKEQEKTKEVDTLPIIVDGYIPEDYVSSDAEKLELYQRLDSVTTSKQLKHLQSQFVDYYGRLPDEVKVLIEKRRLDILASDQKVEHVKEVDRTIQITFTKEYSMNVNGIDLFETVLKTFSDAKFSSLQDKITIIIKKDGRWLERLNNLIEKI